MELRVLTYFEAVARLGSITAAAAEMHVAQPAISRQLAAFQRELGVQLLASTASGTSLTPAGHRFLPRARDLLDGARALEHFARTDAHRTSDVRIACIAATLEHVVSHLIATGVLDTEQAYVVPQWVLVDQLVSNEADVALVLHPPPPPYTSRAFRRLHLTVQVPEELDRWPEKAAVLLDDLVDVPFVTLTRRSASRIRLEEAAAADGLHLAPLADTEHAGVAQAIAVQRGTACVLTEEPPAFGLHWHPLHSRTEGCLTVLLYAAWHPGNALAPEIESIVETLRNLPLESHVRLPGCVPARPEGNENPL